MRHASLRRHGALGLAAGGVLAGHWLTYRMVAPDVHQRVAELAATGHAYLGFVNDLGMALALCAVATVFLGRLTRPNDATPAFGTLLRRIATFQLAAFVTMEVVERLASGSPVSGILHQGLLPLGLFVQLGTAALGALAIRWLLRAADRAHAFVSGPAVPCRDAISLPTLATTPAPAAPWLRATGIRGPPLPSFV